MAALRLLVVLLVAWLVLADFVVAREANPYPHRSAAILLGLILGEVGLVASWSALSRSSWLASAGMVWLTAAAAAWPMSLNTAPSWQAWAGLLLIYAGGVVAVWKLLLAWGVHIDSLGERTQPPEGRLRSRQYSLARLMEITTAAAMTLGIGSWLALPSTEPYVAAASMLGLSLVVPLVLCAILCRTRYGWLRLVALLIVPLAWQILSLFNQPPVALFLTVMVAVEALVALLAALVLSSLGWEGRMAAASEA